MWSEMDAIEVNEASRDPRSGLTHAATTRCTASAEQLDDDEGCGRGGRSRLLTAWLGWHGNLTPTNGPRRAGRRF